MCIDRKTLPAGTPIGYFANGGYEYLGRVGEVVDDAVSVHTAYVAVPDGMTVDEATERLARPADDEWVPWPVEDWGQEPEGARCRDEWTEGAGARVQRYIHRDDVPDPDADLVEAMARVFHEGDDSIPAWPCARADEYRKRARAALAVVREHEAQR